MKWSVRFLMVLLALPAVLAAQPAQVTASAVLAELDRLAVQPLWPGFDPADAAGDLRRRAHDPRPPPLAASGGMPEGDLRVFPGRHRAMIANTSTELGGVQTAR